MINENSYLEKIESMDDAELDNELQHVIDELNSGYQMLRGRDLMIEASIKLCEDAIEIIKKEKSKRTNSRKA